MNHLVTLDPAAQTSTYAERRAQMADETRTRIIDACTAILARGVAELSIPAVAREAGVSVPTVYRNFPDKKTLVRETALHLRKVRGFGSMPSELEGLPDSIRIQFQQSSSVAETVRAALASEPVLAARREAGELERRRDRFRTLLDEPLRRMSPHDREKTLLMTCALCSSASLRMLRDIAGLSPEEAAEAVIWTLEKLLGRELDTKSRKKAKGTKR